MPNSTISQLRFVASISIILLATALLMTPSAGAQTFTVLHQFSGGTNDGSSPEGLIAVDRAGDVYGSAPDGGNRTGICAPLSGCGMVFRAQSRHGAFTYAPLYFFHGNDGAQPFGGVALGPDGALYGTTSRGGTPVAVMMAAAWSSD